jgi:DNA-binding transcriptional ArsR family regulator
MTSRKRGKRGSGSSRAYVNEVVKAASHPTRHRILKALQNGKRTTVELEEATGENRYHLYHHLTVLEESNLVHSRLSGTGKTKEFELLKPKPGQKPDAAYVQVNRDDPEDKKKFKALLDVVRKVTDDQIPNVEKVTGIRIMLSYPWSPSEEE